MINKVFDNQRTKNNKKQILSKRSFQESEIKKDLAIEDLNSEIMSSKTFQLKEELNSELKSKRQKNNMNLNMNSFTNTYNPNHFMNRNNTNIGNNFNFGERETNRIDESSAIFPNSNHLLHSSFNKAKIGNRNNFLRPQKNILLNTVDPKNGLVETDIQEQKNYFSNVQQNTNFQDQIFDNHAHQNDTVLNLNQLQENSKVPLCDRDVKYNSQEIPIRNVWQEITNLQPLNQTIQIKLNQKSFSEQMSNLKLTPIGECTYPLEIKNEIKKMKENSISFKRRDFEEVFISCIICQNKIYFWDFEKNIYCSTKLSVQVRNINLLKIAGNRIYFWVQNENNLGNVFSVVTFLDESNNLRIEVNKIKRTFKTVDSSHFRFVAKGNFLVYLTQNKQIGSIYFDEYEEKVKTQLFDDLHQIPLNKLKRIKKTVRDIFSSKKIYQFKIKILDQNLYVMKSTWKQTKNKTSYNENVFLNNNPLFFEDLDIGINKKYACHSQSISSFKILPQGILKSQGKIKIQNFFQTNRAFLNSSFYQIGGFDFSSKIIDFYIKPIPKNKIISNLLNKKEKDEFVNSIEVLSELNEDLFKLNEHPDLEVSGLTSENVVLLLENGIEIEVQPYDSVLRSLTTFNLVQDNQVEKEEAILKNQQGMDLIGYLSDGEILGLKNQKLYLLLRQNIEKTKSIQEGCYVYVADFKQNYSKVLDSRHISERRAINKLKNDFCSENNQFKEIQNQFLSNSSNKMTTQELFFNQMQFSNLLIGLENVGFKFVKINSLKDYLVSFFLILISDDHKQPRFFYEYSEIFIKFVKLFNIETVIENLLFLLSMQNFNKNSCSFCVEWIKSVLANLGSQISIKQAEILEEIDDDPKKLTLSNFEFIQIKSLIVSLLKVFGGFTSTNESLDWLLNSILDSIYKWRISNRMSLNPICLNSNNSNNLLSNKSLVQTNNCWLSGSLNITLIKMFGFEIEKIFHRNMIVIENNEKKKQFGLLNRDNTKIRLKVKGILNYLLKDQQNSKESQNKLNNYISKNFTDNCIKVDFRKNDSDFDFRLNIGIDEIKYLLEVMINSSQFIKNLKTQWISNKFNPFTDFLMKRIDTKEKKIHEIISSNLEQFPKEQHLKDIYRIEIFLKLFVNLLILDNISSKYLSDLISDLKDKSFGECLMNKSFDYFWKYLCFEIGHKFFFDRNSIYEYFLDESIVKALKHFDKTLIELKNCKFGKERKIRYDNLEHDKSVSFNNQMGTRTGRISKKRSRTHDIYNRQESEDVENDLKFEKLIKESFNKAKLNLEKLKVDQLMSLGKIFTWRGNIKEAVYFMNLIGSKFEDLKEQEKLCSTNSFVKNFSFSNKQNNNLKLGHSDLNNNSDISLFMAEKLTNINAQIQDIKLFFISLILNVQKKRLHKQNPDSLFEKVKNWISTQINKIYSINEDENNKKADFEIFLENLTQTEIELFWKETLEMILNLKNEELRIFILQTILSIGKTNSLKLIENSLRESDLMLLIDKGLKLEGKSGVQNFLFLINFFEKKKNPQMAMILIMKLIQNEYLPENDMPKTKIRLKLFSDLFTKLTHLNKTESQNWEFEKKELEKVYFVSLEQKISLLKQGKFISNGLPEHSNKKKVLSKIKSNLKNLTFQKMIKDELNDTQTKVQYLLSSPLLKKLKLKQEVLIRLNSLIGLLLLKLSFGVFSPNYLLETIVQRFYLFVSFDHFLKNFKVKEEFLNVNHFENLLEGVSHYGKSSSVKSSLKLSSLIKLVDLKEESNPNLDEICQNFSLIGEEMLQDLKSFNETLLQSKVEVLSNMVKGNMIFPYNIYPSFMSLLTKFMFSSDSYLNEIEIKKNNEEIFDNFNMIQHQQEFISSQNNQNSINPNHFKDKVDLVTEIQFHSANNLLLMNLLQENMSAKLQEKGVKQEPLWFVEHLLQNLHSSENGIKIFKIFHQSWKNQTLTSQSAELGLFQNGTFKKRFQNRLNICLLKIVDFCLNTQNKNFENFMLSLNEEDKMKIKKSLLSFEENIPEISSVLNFINNGKSQQDLLEFSNEVYLLWCSSIMKDLAQYRQSNKRRKII